MFNENQLTVPQSETGPILAADQSPNLSQTITKEYEPRTIMGRIGQSAFAQKIALITATLIGGGTITGLPGCRTHDQGAQQGFKDGIQLGRNLEKEAKFSTLASDAQIPLGNMQSLLEERNVLNVGVTEAIGPIATFTKKFEESHQISSDGLLDLQKTLQAANQALLTAQQSESFTPSSNRIAEISEGLNRASLLTEQDFGTDTTSPGYLSIVKVQSDIYDLYNALERDIGMLHKGVYANSIAELTVSLMSVESQLSIISQQPHITEWGTAHPLERSLVENQISKAVKIISAAEEDSSFAKIHNDLRDTRVLLSDVMKLVTTTPQGEVSASNFFTEPSHQKAVVIEALHLVQALRTDLTKELTLALGAEPLTTNTPSTTAATPSAHPHGASTASATTNHYHGGGGFWYMPINTGSGYHGNYTYTPYQAHAYSGADRLRTSPEYQTFASTSHETHSVLAGKSGISSHENGSLVRESSHSSAISSHTSPSHSSHVGASSSGSKGTVGGFNSGKSFSSGFGS